MHPSQQGQDEFCDQRDGRRASERLVERERIVELNDRRPTGRRRLDGDEAIAREIELTRPKPLREFDQIAMHGGDLMRQARFVAPLLENKRVAFVGDFDGTAMALGMLGVHGVPGPARMHLLDFDERVLDALQAVACRHNFAERVAVDLYNAFDPLPEQFVGEFDYFYTNPPYGSHNDGASARLFINRGCDLVHPNGAGCVILPYDITKTWTCTAMLETQRFLTYHGWTIRLKQDGLHGYDLDDDPNLRSSLLVVDSTVGYEDRIVMPFTNRRVDHSEIPRFYGREVLPPYPEFIPLHGRPRSDREIRHAAS